MKDGTCSWSWTALHLRFYGPGERRFVVFLEDSICADGVLYLLPLEEGLTLRASGLNTLSSLSINKPSISKRQARMDGRLGRLAMAEVVEYQPDPHSVFMEPIVVEMQI